MMLRQGRLHPFSSNARRSDEYACCKEVGEAAGSKSVTNCLYGNRKRLTLWEEQRPRRSTSSCKVPHRDCSRANTGTAELPFLTFVNPQFVSRKSSYEQSL